MAVVEDIAPEPKKGPSFIIQIGVLLVMSLLAAGIGWFSGHSLGGSVQHEASAEAETTAAGHDQPAAGGHGEAAGGHGEAKKEGADGEDAATASPNPLVVNLPPITTNLAAPSDTWARIELSIELDAPSKDPTLVDTIHQDLLAFMRTVKLHQIEGASGFQHLKADMTERAAIRSEGHVKAVLIRTLLFE